MVGRGYLRVGGGTTMWWVVEVEIEVESGADVLRVMFI
jgi:hypothetical protein